MFTMVLLYLLQKTPGFKPGSHSYTARLILTRATKILAKLNSFFFGVNPDLV